MTNRPNILLITSDQQRDNCFGFEGRKVKTPHLDLMARQGARFAACITPNNVCQPSRASMLTGLLRVGMIFKGPGIPSGKVVADPVATTDLAATFYDYCDVDAGREFHSRSLRKVMDDRESRHYAYNEWRMHPSRTGLALDLRCVRTRNAKLTLELGSGAGELYLLKDDPTEMDNRFGDPATAKLQKELTDMIHARPQDILSVLPEPIGMA